MSATHRNLTRLPLHVFENLVQEQPQPQQGENENDDGTAALSRNPEQLRNAICLKLKQANFTATTGSGGSHGVTTVGDFLKLSSTVLMRIVDPLLIHAECEVLISRVCQCCAPTPITAFHLLKATEANTDGTITTTNRKEKEGVNHKRYLSSGMSILDSCLKGGFRIGTISEVVGRAGVGKTQLALQLCVVAARYNQGCVYIDTEKKLSLHRLKEIAEERVKTCNHTHSNGGGGDATSISTSALPSDGDFSYMGSDNFDIDISVQEEEGNNNSSPSGPRYKSAREVLENITVHSPGSTHELLSVVANIEEEILLRNQEVEDQASNDCTSVQKFPVRLVILDSIAAPTRRDFGKESAPQRVSAIFQVAQMLKRVADQLQVAVVVINQVGLQQGGDTATGIRNSKSVNLMGDDVNTADTNDNSIGSDLVAVSAALGTSWHHCVSTRLLLEHERDPHRLNTILDEAHSSSKRKTYEDADNNNTAAWKFERGHIRTATLVKSNTSGYSRMAYEVTSIGLKEL